MSEVKKTSLAPAAAYARLTRCAWDTRNMRDKTSLIQPEQIEQVILLIRGQRVMLDRDLAALYGVDTNNLNKAVRRNLDRFPADFLFQLMLDEAEARAPSRFQFRTLK
jgi:hypothetical protein